MDLPVDGPRLNILYLMQDKIQSFADGKYDVTQKDIEGIYFSQRGDAAEQIEALTITKRLISTGKSHRGTFDSAVTNSLTFSQTHVGSPISIWLHRRTITLGPQVVHQLNLLRWTRSTSVLLCRNCSEVQPPASRACRFTGCRFRSSAVHCWKYRAG